MHSINDKRPLRTRFTTLYIHQYHVPKDFAFFFLFVFQLTNSYAQNCYLLSSKNNLWNVNWKKLSLYMADLRKIVFLFSVFSFAFAVCLRSPNSFKWKYESQKNGIGHMSEIGVERNILTPWRCVISKQNQNNKNIQRLKVTVKFTWYTTNTCVFHYWLWMRSQKLNETPIFCDFWFVWLIFA